MTHPLETTDSQAQLVTYFFTRREAILSKWRTACEQDPTLSKVSALSSAEFNNMLPLALNSLEQRLLGQPEQDALTITARVHGLHRWHKANGLTETLRELDHLSQVLDDELSSFKQQFPNVDTGELLVAQRQIALLMQQMTNGSVEQYNALQQAQAATRVQKLQQALDQMAELSQERGDLLRSSTHDLRGSVGLINSTASLLSSDELNEMERKKFMAMLNRNLNSMQDMLTQLMDLSRLEAGQEQRHIESVDVGKLLRELVASAQPMADERGITLSADGPPTLMVQTDRVKLQRIAQNLLLNALKYTNSAQQRVAIVSLSWSAEGHYRWNFGVQDSGPGLPAAVSEELGQQLRPAVEPTSSTGPGQSGSVAVTPSDVSQALAPDKPGDQ